MTRVELPPQFQPHPECAAGVITIDQAVMMIHLGWLTSEGARWMFPPIAWCLFQKNFSLMTCMKRRSEILIPYLASIVLILTAYSVGVVAIVPTHEKAPASAGVDEFQNT
jgi:hypothetical protein